MAYSKERKEEILTNAFNLISGGLSLRKALQDKSVNIPRVTFFDWINILSDDDEETVKWKQNQSNQYTRATELRQGELLDEIMEVASGQHHTDKEDKFNQGAVQRDKLHVHALEWSLSKMNPKKYGNRVQHASDPDNPLPAGQTSVIPVVLPNGKTLDDYINKVLDKANETED